MQLKFKIMIFFYIHEDINMSLTVNNNNNNVELFNQKKQVQQNGGTQKDYTAMIAEEMLKSSVQNLQQATSGNPIVSMITGVIMGAMGIGGVGATQGAQETQATQGTQESGTVDTEAIEQAKQGCESDLAAMKKAGITVSDWDKNNTCTLSADGKTATISISNSGQIQFSGDMEAMANKLKASDPAQQESVDNQNKFIEEQKKAGDPVVGDVKTTSITVNGKSVQVNEYTTQSGKKLYLDDNGKQVSPDTSMS